MSEHKQVHQALSKLDLSPFKQAHLLPDEYDAIAKQWFVPLIETIASARKAQQPMVIGINGTQGSGKSTLADLLVYVFKEAFQLSAVALSLDDFYLTKAERNQLAQTVHPLFATRGVPGTHDTQLAIHCIESLKSQTLPVAVPRFNKAVDERAEEMEFIDEPIDVIIFEGWCVGATPQSEQALTMVPNALESNEDADGIWRMQVNNALAGEYQTLFSLIDYLIMLKAPSFDCVYQWRLEQEEKLRAKTGGGQQVMSADQVARFIQFYQRLTEHTLETLPERVHCLYQLDHQRRIIKMTTSANTLNVMQSKHDDKQWLIFTDMDGTLLDHHNYSFEAAKPMLAACASNGIPVMPITSKTQAELESLRKTLNNQHPFIIENGAAVLIPIGYFEKQPADTEVRGDYWVKSFVKPRAHWQELIKEVSGHYQEQYTTFAEAGVDGVMAMTGLDEAAAKEASQRQYGEPMQWQGDEASKQAMITELNARGANILEGGRFVHVSGRSDKGLALEWLREVFKANHPSKSVMTLALGDSQNDVAMLEVADYAVVVKSPVKAAPVINRAQNLLMTKQTGPSGWAEGVQHFTQLSPQP